MKLNTKTTKFSNFKLGATLEFKIKEKLFLIFGGLPLP